MNDAITNLTTEQHRNTAAALFNYTWELIESPDKKQDTIDEMINVAHASCFHWLKAGNPVNQARGHWLIFKSLLHCEQDRIRYVSRRTLSGYLLETSPRCIRSRIRL